MKPDWKPTVNGLTPSWLDAPEWANYAAMDKEGDWYWYEKEPTPGKMYWIPQDGRTLLIEEFRISYWKSSLTKRPGK